MPDVSAGDRVVVTFCGRDLRGRVVDIETPSSINSESSVSVRVPSNDAGDAGPTYCASATDVRPLT